MTVPWQAPDSSVQGILQEQRIEPGWDRDFGINGNWYHASWAEGQRLEDFLQQWVAAVASLDGGLVRPRWQAEPIPNLPPFETPCWAATGITRMVPLGIYAYVGHHGGEDIGNGWDEMQRHEELDLLVSFYGPDSDEVAGRFHSNLMVWQNTSLLKFAGIKFVDPGNFTWVPELVKEQWLMRVDKTVTLRRIVVRKYPVLNFLEFAGRVETSEGYHAPFGWPPPAERDRGIADAPHDDVLYVRQSRQWQPGLPLAGGRMKGPLQLAGDATDPLEAATKRQIDEKEGGRY